MKNWQFVTLLLVVIAGFVYLGYRMDKVENDYYRNYSEIIGNAGEITHIKNTTDTILEGIIDIRNLIQTY